jgi:hypothetical protein
MIADLMVSLCHGMCSALEYCCVLCHVADFVNGLFLVDIPWRIGTLEVNMVILFSEVLAVEYML